MTDRDLSSIPTDELRAELAQRDKARDAANREAFRLSHLCPECGGDPAELNEGVVEEFRFAPHDDQGRPMLYAPYELGEIKGARYEQILTCENGHVTVTDKIRWFDHEEAKQRFGRGETQVRTGNSKRAACRQQDSGSQSPTASEAKEAWPTRLRNG